MSIPPRRLKDDPGFLWETGCDLADEAFAVGGYGLPGVRANVLAATQPPSAGAPLRATRTWSVAAKIGGALALLGLGGLAGVGLVSVATAPAPVESPVAPVAAPAEVVAAPAEVVAAPTEVAAAPAEVLTAPVLEVDEGLDAHDEATEGDEALVIRPAAAPIAIPTPPAPVAPPASGQGDAPLEDLGGPSVPAVGSAEVPEAAAPAQHPVGVDTVATRPASTLAAEVAMYDGATERLAGGDADGAILEYQRYIERYPKGRLVTESELGLMRAQVALGPSEAVEALAIRLLTDGDLASRHDDLRRMRADNLVLLGRCGDALAVARDLPSRDAAPIRRACRWKP